MKLSKHKELLIIIVAAFSIFLVAGPALASDTETLQPAETITYNEDLVVNGTGRFNSVYIGSTVPGEGGVTFFNGTMINASTTESGGGVPLTVGDDIRIDGMIWRGSTKGMADGQPLKIADTMMPALDNANDIGTEDNQWRNIYYRDTLQGGSAHVEELTADTGAIAHELTVADYIAVGGGIWA